MSMRTTLLALPLALVLAASFAAAQPETAVAAPAVTAWFAQSDAMLKASLENRKGLLFYVDGQTIGGAVKQIGSDFVIVANQEHGQILIRLDRIDAVAAN